MLSPIFFELRCFFTGPKSDHCLVLLFTDLVEFWICESCYMDLSKLAFCLVFFGGRFFFNCCSGVRGRDTFEERVSRGRAGAVLLEDGEIFRIM